MDENEFDLQDHGSLVEGFEDVALFVAAPLTIGAFRT